MRLTNPKKTYSYFNSNFRIQESTKGWWIFKCPFCAELENRKKMAVNFIHGHCKCWICGYSDNVVNFVSDFEGVGIKESKQILKTTTPQTFKMPEISVKQELKSIELPKGYHSILEGNHLFGDRARNYLTSRGFDLNEMDRLGIGYCYHELELDEAEDYFGYIIIPFQIYGSLVYYIGRDFMGNFLRYKNPPKSEIGVGKADLVYNSDSLELYDKIYVFEGWADALTIGRNSVSTQGWSLSKRQESILINNDCEELIFVPDYGADNTGVTFYDKAMEAALKFIEHKKVKVLDLERFGEGADANTIGKQKIIELEKETEYIDFQDIIRNSLK